MASGRRALTTSGPTEDAPGASPTLRPVRTLLIHNPKAGYDQVDDQKRDEHDETNLERGLEFADDVGRHQHFHWDLLGALERRGFREPPLPLLRSRLAKLVHQGSDPTLPYQALLTRESARLFLGFAPFLVITLGVLGEQIAKIICISHPP